MWKNAEPVQRFGIVLLSLSIFIASIGYFERISLFSFSSSLNWIFSDFYANLSTELFSIAITVLIIDKLNSNRSQDQIILQLQKERTLDLYDEYESPGMIKARMKIHLLLEKNNGLEKPVTFYEMYQNMSENDPNTINPNTNDKNIDTWTYISTLILFFGKLGQYRNNNLLDKNLFINFLSDFEYYYVRCLHRFIDISIIDSIKRDQPSRVELFRSIDKLAEWAKIDINSSNFSMGMTPAAYKPYIEKVDNPE